MFEHYLSNKNERVTVAPKYKFRELRLLLSQSRNSLPPLLSSTRSEKCSQNPATGADKSREPNRTTRSPRALLRRTTGPPPPLPGSSSSSLLRRPYRRSPGRVRRSRRDPRRGERERPGRQGGRRLTSPRLVVFCGVRSSSSLPRHPPAARPPPEEDAAVRLVPSPLHFGDC